MITWNQVKTNRYQDSVTLMQTATQLRALGGIEDASLMMGTGPNKEILVEAGLLTPDGQAAGPNDLIVAMRGTQEAVESAQGQVEDLLRAEIPVTTEREQAAPHTIAAGLQTLPEANLALISTPGLYAASEARKALLAGRHVMIFSDNVSLDDELALKTLASERGLLLMGPDCGTAIIGGVPLGFANVVRRGSVGVVGASGTGMQEVTTLVDRYGGGVSHAIGTGSHDLAARIGGAMTLAALKALLDDPATAVVVVVSKPPDPQVAARVLEAVSGANKPVIVAFLGMDPAKMSHHMGNTKLVFASTLEDAAHQAVALSGGNIISTDDVAREAVSNVAARLQPTQKYVRGLFSGGTFCYEAMLILQPVLGPIYSNAPLSPDLILEIRNPQSAIRNRHACLDLGADEFTVGRPHPMIDVTARAERILVEAANPEVAVILLDIVLGYGSHPDPAGALAEAIHQAKAIAADGGRALPIVASICGTQADPQNLEKQRRTLQEIGVLLADSNAAAARLAARVASTNVSPKLAFEQSTGSKAQ